jgi:hypothetical protein
MEAWSHHMLGVALLMQARTAEAGDAAANALRLFDAAGDLAGVTLGLDALAVAAVAEEDRPRAGRLWGAARRLQESSGTGLAEWDETIYTELPIGVRTALSAEELAALSKEGASLSLAEAVAYAHKEEDPFGTSDARPA